MQAFLLLDEQNLKDIGVSTMGARKKIYNAILSKFGEKVTPSPFIFRAEGIRETARLFGVNLHAFALSHNTHLLVLKPLSLGRFTTKLLEYNFQKFATVLKFVKG